MELYLKDRVIILNSVLPLFDTRANTIVKASIVEKIQLSAIEREQVEAVPVGNGQYNISFKTVGSILNKKEYTFTSEEVNYMKQRVDFIDQNGMFSVDTMDTYEKILKAGKANEDVQPVEQTLEQPAETV
jgi:transcriptional/translational regulatory protein YebC/TACO1